VTKLTQTAGKAVSYNSHNCRAQNILDASLGMFSINVVVKHKFHLRITQEICNLPQ